MRQFARIFLFWAGVSQPALADGFTPLSGAEITEALSDQTLLYGDARQVFYTSGRTLYETARPSWGRWRVTGDQYCSQWPPSNRWSCYDMARDGDTLRFIGADGATSDGVYEE